MGTAVVSGPHLHNFVDIARQLGDAGALRVGADAEAVGADVEALLADPDARQRMAEAGLKLVRDGRGALRRTLDVIAPDLPRRRRNEKAGASAGFPLPRLPGITAARARSRRR